MKKEGKGHDSQIPSPALDYSRLICVNRKNLPRKEKGKAGEDQRHCYANPKHQGNGLVNRLLSSAPLVLPGHHSSSAAHAQAQHVEYKEKLIGQR